MTNVNYKNWSELVKDGIDKVLEAHYAGKCILPKNECLGCWFDEHLNSEDYKKIFEESNEQN